MDTEYNNGHGGEARTQSQMILTLDRAQFTLTIGGHTENYDEALAMLELARRSIEAKMRSQAIAETLRGPAGVTLPNLRGRH